MAEYLTAQKVLSSAFINQLKSLLYKGEIPKDYLAGGIKPSNADILVHPNLVAPEANKVALKIPDGHRNYDFDNSLAIFEHFKGLTITEATDARLWTYLTHVTFWGFMNKRRPIESEAPDKRPTYILRHYFVDPVNAGNLLRNDISLFWWGAFLTHDSERKDPFELTRELFSMLDYTRHFLPSTQGRNRNFVHGVLEFVIENPSLFSKYKEDKLRFVMRKCNLIAGYKVFPILSKQEIKATVGEYAREISAVRPPKEEVVVAPAR